MGVWQGFIPAEGSRCASLLPVRCVAARGAGEWLHCCDRLMEMEVETPPKPALFLTKQADSVYNDLSEWGTSELSSTTG